MVSRAVILTSYADWPHRILAKIKLPLMKKKLLAIVG